MKWNDTHWLVYEHKFKAPFTLEIYFEILFRNKILEIFLSKVSTFTLKINFQKPDVNNMTDTSEMFVNTGAWLTNHSTP